ncbi:MAG: hypothetical protein FJ278_11020, partial [Planctomycetes bacterium]|nr:hypothetical protein [Planctomycetota bacterium]
MRCVTCATVVLVALAFGAFAQDRGPASERIQIQMDAGAFEGLGIWPLGVGVPLPKGKVKSVEALGLRSEKHGAI